MASGSKKMMLWLVGLLLLIPAASNAQTHYAANIAVGAKGGVDLSRVFFSPHIKQKWLLGANFGVMFRYIEENHFGIIAELDFVQRGWKENFEKYPFSYERTLNYIELPVLAHIYFGRRGRFYVNLGPQIGYYLGESEKANFDTANAGSILDFPTNRHKEQYSLKPAHKLDYGISAGVGGEFFANRRHSVIAEVRFYYGLGNVFSAKRTDTFQASNCMSLMCTLGYWFRLK